MHPLHRLTWPPLRKAAAVRAAAAPLVRGAAAGGRREAATAPPFTSERYSVARGAFKALGKEDVEHFRGLLPAGGVLTSEDDLDGYNVDWLRTMRGQSKIVLRPSSTEEVSSILTYCNQQRLAVCPQGGNTGLVGGSVPVFDEVVLSMAKMDRIVSVDEVSGILVCEAGCVLERLSTHLSDHGLRVPLDLGAKGSCQLGGNVSTNAGGLRYLRYGSLHGSVLGAEFVLADGSVVDVLSGMRKDNTGYDLKQLLIGSEGTLGVVTKLALACPPKPASEMVALLGCTSYEGVLLLFREAKRHLGEILSAFEFFDAASVDVLRERLQLNCPLASQSAFYVLIEAGGSNPTHDEEKVNSFLESMLEAGHVEDGTVAAEPSKVANIWAVRERITEALTHDGYVYKYDVSLPLRELYQLVEDTRARLAGRSDVIRVVGFGHVGDGNLHLNVTGPSFEEPVLDLLEPWLWERARACRGSISAEHGVGFKKRDVLNYSKPWEAIRLMQLLKQTLDPNGILNPYKTVPAVE